MSYTSNLHDALRLKMFEQAEAIMYKPVSDSSLSIIEIGQIWENYLKTQESSKGSRFL